MSIDEEFQRFQEELLQTFLGEAREHVEEVEQLLIEWSQSKHEEPIRDVFRRIHSIKGSSAACNLLDLSFHVHDFEELLKDVVEGNLSYSDDLYDAMLACIDALADAVKEMRGEGRSESDRKIPQVISKFRASTQNSQSLPTPAVPPKVSDKIREMENEESSVGKITPLLRFTSEVPTVLFCDDDDTFAGMIERVLHKEGFNVVRCRNGEEGFETFKSQKVDLVLADYQMPGKSGIEMLEDIRVLNSKVPFVLMSGQAKIDDLVKSMLEFDACYYLEKPVSVNVLRLAVRQAVRIFFTQTILEEMCAHNFRAYVSTKKLAFNKNNEEKREMLETEISRSMSAVVKLVEKLRNSISFAQKSKKSKAS